MKNYLKILQNCSLFSDIEENNIESVLLCLDVQIKTYQKNETIIAEGMNNKYIGILLSGSAQIERTDYYGNRSIVTSIEPSELFGESFACAGIEKMPVSVVATQISDVIIIGYKKIIHTCQNNCAYHNQLVLNLLKTVANKNILLNQKAEIISKRTTREKLMTYLMFQAKKNKSNTFTIPYDRQTLADFLEVDRSGLSNEISKLRNEGILESHKNEFKLL